MTLPRRTILLDLDGTLTDPAPGLVASIRHAFAELGLEPPGAHTITPYIGPPLEHALRGLLPPAAQRLLPEAVRLYRQRYADIGLFENAVYPGIPQALQALRTAGARLLLATSKPQPFAARILQHFELSAFFQGAYGSHFDGRLANKADLLAHLLHEERLPAAQALMVGDRLYDVRAAEACGLPALGAVGLWQRGRAARRRRPRPGETPRRSARGHPRFERRRHERRLKAAGYTNSCGAVILRPRTLAV